MNKTSLSAQRAQNPSVRTRNPKENQQPPPTQKATPTQKACYSLSFVVFIRRRS